MTTDHNLGTFMLRSVSSYMWHVFKASDEYCLNDGTKRSDGPVNSFVCSSQGEDPYPWPMFSSYPLPACYTLDPPKILHNSHGERNFDRVSNINCCIMQLWCLPIVSFSCTESEISAFLASSKESKNEESWVEICRRLYCKVMTSKPNVLTGKGKQLVDQVAFGFAL